MNSAQYFGLNLVIFNFALVVVCVVVSLLSLAINERGAWYWMSFRQFVRSRKSTHKATISKALVAENIDALADNIREATSQLARQLDRHMVWLSAGAIYFIIQFMHRTSYENQSMLTFSFVYFQFCIIAVVTSYFLQHEASLRAGRAPGAVRKIEEIIDRDFPATIKQIETTKGYIQAAEWWSYLRSQIILSRLFAFFLVIFNGLAYFAFIVGIISFTVFIVINK